MTQLIAQSSLKVLRSINSRETDFANKILINLIKIFL